jgi:hypothetical protein
VRASRGKIGQLREQNKPKNRRGEIRRIRRERRNHLGQKSRARPHGMTGQPFPHRVPASLHVEIDASALHHEHEEPSKKKHAAAQLCQSGRAAEIAQIEGGFRRLAAFHSRRAVFHAGSGPLTSAGVTRDFFCTGEEDLFQTLRVAEPAATSFPSLMMAASLRNRSTWSSRCEENKIVRPNDASSRINSKNRRVDSTSRPLVGRRE